MTDTWLDRLHEAIEKDGRSLRAISSAAGYGPNFVQQLLKYEKEPGIDKLARVLDVLGREAALYVLAGIRMTDEDQEFLEIITGLEGSAKADGLRFLRSIQSGAGKQEPPDDDQE
jgi:transcriptional regulator with XRE-family HTH domain